MAMAPMPDPNPVTVIITHVEQYACGCTTTREERILLPAPDHRQCAAHHAPLKHITHRTQYEAPAEEGWQLRPTP
jgi:hypothetical protein